MKARTFLAIEISDAVRAEVVGLIEDLAAAGDSVKWVEPENLHVTLKFFGDVAGEEIHSLARAVEEVCREHDPFEIALAGVGAFPHLDRPRTLWIGVGQGADGMVALAESLEARFVALGYPAEGRRFHPHLTLGRLRGQPQAIAGRLRRIRDAQFGHVLVDRLVLMSSTLDRRGPTYTPLATMCLGES
jgi:2'-5' RNA ligase